LLMVPNGGWFYFHLHIRFNAAKIHIIFKLEEIFRKFPLISLFFLIILFLFVGFERTGKGENVEEGGGMIVKPITGARPH